MTATAIYDKIDPNLPGAFSSKMVDGLLRKQLGFDGFGYYQMIYQMLSKYNHGRLVKGQF